MSVAHLKDLHEEYRGRGFDIFALTNEDPIVVSRFVHLQDPNVVYPVAIGTRHSYGSCGIPHAKLVGVDGTVVWEGHPARLTGDIIEAELKTVRRYGDIDGRSARKAGRDFDKGEFGKALIEGRRIADDERSEPTDVDSAKRIVAEAQAVAERRLAWADALAREGRVERAKEILEDMEDSFARTEFAERATIEENGAFEELEAARKTVERFLSRRKPPIKGDDREAIRVALKKKLPDFVGRAAKCYLSEWLEILSEDWIPKR